MESRVILLSVYLSLLFEGCTANGSLDAIQESFLVPQKTVCQREEQFKDLYKELSQN